MTINRIIAAGSLSRGLVGAVVLALCVATGVNAQYNGTIDAGTVITVRTNEEIRADQSDGYVFSGSVDQDVLYRNRTVAIPKGSEVELVVKEMADNQVALDLDAIVINGQRHGVQTDDSIVESERKDGIGVNKRTGKYVGGGALLGAIVGAIAGGGKGAAIGAGAGAAAGAGVQIVTRGRSVNVPVESLLTFRLQQPIQTGAEDYRSRWYRSTYNDDRSTSAAYRAGLVAGRSDADRNLRANTRSTRWTSDQDRRDYEAGYNRGYQQNQGTTSNDNLTYESASIHIGADNNITWHAPAKARVFVQADNRTMQLFAEGQSGTQTAPWIEPGHLYVFILRDMNGNELARDRLDLRQSREYRRNVR